MKILSAVVLCLLSFVVSAGVDHGRIMAVGDSLTAGTFPAWTAYRGPFDALATANADAHDWVGPNGSGVFPSGENQYHAGNGGWSLNHILEGHPDFPAKGKLGDWLQEYYPDTVIFIAGTNDWWRWRNTWFLPGTQDQAYTYLRHQYIEVMKLVLEEDRTLIFGSIPRSNIESAAGRQEYEDLALKLLKQLSAQIKRGQDVRLVDLTSWLNPSIHLSSDGIHWSEAGAAEAAERLYQASL